MLLVLIDRAWNYEAAEDAAAAARAAGVHSPRDDETAARVLLRNLLAKALAWTANPRAATWDASAAVRVNPNDAAYSLEGGVVGNALRAMWEQCPALRAARAFPACGRRLVELLEGEPLIRLRRYPLNASVVYAQLDLYALLNVERPLAGAALS